MYNCHLDTQPGDLGPLKGCYLVTSTERSFSPAVTKATRLDQETLKVYSQNYLLRCSDGQQELCTSRISFQRLGTADRPLHHEQQWVLQ